MNDMTGGRCGHSADRYRDGLAEIDERMSKMGGIPSDALQPKPSSTFEDIRHKVPEVHVFTQADAESSPFFCDAGEHKWLDEVRNGLRKCDMCGIVKAVEDR